MPSELITAFVAVVLATGSIVIAKWIDGRSMKQAEKPDEKQNDPSFGEETMYIGKISANAFKYLFEDADWFLAGAKKSTEFDRVRICRTAVLLYVLSLEGLINRCMDAFLPAHLRDFFMEKEKSLSPMDKFLLVPLLVTGKTFDKSEAVWAKLKQLFDLRNDYVHPKHDTHSYVKFLSKSQVDPLDPDEIPEDLGVKPKDLHYLTLGIPRDPYSVLPHHLKLVRAATVEVVDKLDELLEGKVKKGDWHTNDNAVLVYPPGAKLSEVPGAKLSEVPE